MLLPLPLVAVGCDDGPIEPELAVPATFRAVAVNDSTPEGQRITSTLCADAPRAVLFRRMTLFLDDLDERGRGDFAGVIVDEVDCLEPVTNTWAVGGTYTTSADSVHFRSAVVKSAPWSSLDLDAFTAEVTHRGTVLRIDFERDDPMRARATPGLPGLGGPP